MSVLAIEHDAMRAPLQRKLALTCVRRRAANNIHREDLRRPEDIWPECTASPG